VTRPASATEPAPRARDGRSAELALLVAVVVPAVLLAHREALDAWFAADDFLWLEISTFDSVLASFVGPWGHGAAYRPLSRLSFLIDYALFGLDARPWHAHSLLNHAGTATLLGWLVLRVSGERALALAVAVIFATRERLVRRAARLPRARAGARSADPARDAVQRNPAARAPAAAVDVHRRFDSARVLRDLVGTMQSGSSKVLSASGAPFLATVGVRVAAVSAERARLELPYRGENANRNGSLHGGVVAATIDIAAATVAAAGLDPARRGGASTIDFTVHYLAPAVREDATAEAVVLRRGRDITFVEVTVATAARPIARGLIAYRAGAGGRPSRSPVGAADGQREPHHPTAQLTAVADDQFVRRTSGSPFTRRLGVASAQLGRGHAISLLPLADAILAEDGTVHEGALAALVDCAGGAAAWSIDGFDPDGRAATIGMHLCFDVGTRGEDVAAEAINSWNSDGVYVNSVVVAGRASGRAVASGSVTYRIVKRLRRA